MLSKIVITVLFLSSKCLGELDFTTSTISTTEYTTIKPINRLEELKMENYEVQTKQLTNITLSNITVTSIATNPSPVTNVVSNNKPSPVTNAVSNNNASPVTNVVSNNTSPVTTVIANNTTNPVTSVVNNVVNRIPCSCAKGQCGCCTGALLESFNQKACLNITYEPDEFAFNAAFSLNGRVFYKNRISGKNPPPICIRVPRIRIVRVCARFSNVYFTGPNMHACVGMEASWDDFTLFETLINCFRIGGAGVAVVPPEDGGGISGAVDEDDDDDDDIFDYDDSARGFKDRSL